MNTSVLTGIQSVELEITGTCQLRCTHCCTDSGPTAPPGTMTREDWQHVIADIAALGIPAIQLIGGEPTLSPHWTELLEQALGLGLMVEVYSNLFHIKPQWWDVLAQDGVTLATSYYSDDAAEHDRVTTRPGSHRRTRANIAEALRRGIPLRAGIVEVLDGQRVAEARADLETLGVTNVTIDRMRGVGRASGHTSGTGVAELCGRCGRGKAAVLPTGEVALCLMAREMPVGNVREQRLADILTGRRWSRIAALIPAPRTAGCSPDDQSCQPGQPACLPKFPAVPPTPRAVAR
ncbi:hypothetical protein GCM10027168_66280 [Streptomyces capparidis]